MLNSLSLRMPFRPPPGAPPFRTRLRAWWDGEDLPPAPPEDESEDEVTAVEAEEEIEPVEEDYGFWDPGRVDIAQRVWQAGYVAPSGDVYNRDFVRPTALKPAHSVLHLGAGLGGMARLMAREFGVWVTALEESPRLVTLGNEQSNMAGLAKKATIKVFDPNKIKLRKRSFDRIFSQDIFHRIEDKKALLSKVANALKPKSQFLFTDFLLAESAEMEMKVSDWAELEPEKSEPWSVDQMKSYLEEIGLMVRIAEDQTAEYRALVLDSWGAFLEDLQRDGAPESLDESVLAEAERWSACIEAMDQSVLRSYRIMALSA